MSEWRDDEYGIPRQALYLGGLFVGNVLEWRKTGKWRGWFMSDDSGAETGWFDTADEARASVETALATALRDEAERVKET